jgi:hypothetical protein
MTTQKQKRITGKGKENISPQPVLKNTLSKTENNQNGSNDHRDNPDHKILIGKTWKECDKTDRVMAITTIIIAAFTAFLLLVSYLQVSIYIDATHIENRAYLVISNIIPDTLLDGNTIKAQIVITNNGKTPAYKIDHQYGCKIGLPITAKELETTEPQFLHSDVQNVVGGNVTYGFMYDSELMKFNLRRGDASEIYSGKRILTVFGKFTYLDKFGESHFVRYAVQWNHKTNSFDFLNFFNDSN